MSMLKNLPPTTALPPSSLQGINKTTPPSISIPNAPSTGIINNVVVFIRFKGESEFTTPLATYDTLFNNTTTNFNSVYNYFQQVSYNTLKITSYFFPLSATPLVVSYEDPQPRAYYEPFSATNPIGYQGGNDGPERTAREQTLIANATKFVKPQVDASTLNLDTDGDGFVDNICYIIKGTPGDWGTILWPHKWSLFAETVLLRGAKVGVYNVQIESIVNTGVLCHEMLHSLGFTDLYHYNFDALNPIGIWDIMANTTNPPQSTSAYMKFRYSKWIANIPEISAPGTYTLNPLSSPTNNCYKITSPLSATEYFVVEYRKKDTVIDSTLPGSGVLVYRVNTTLSGKGNDEGPPDELYVFRPGGTPTSAGTINNAYLTSDVGRTSIGGTSNPLFFSNGTNSDIVLTNITAAGNTISFTIPGAPTDQADLSITKSSSPNPVNPGQKLTYTLSINNAGPSAAQAVFVSDTLPAQLAASEYSLNGGITWQPWTGTYSLGTLNAGSSITILIRATVLNTATGTITNTATVSSTTPDPNPNNNTSTIVTTILSPDQADLSITKSASPSPVTPGQKLVYTLSIRNNGPSAAQAISVSDTLPTQLSGGEYSLNGGTTWQPWTGTYSLGTLNAGSSTTILIRATVLNPATGTITNTATVSSTTPDPNPSNNTSTIVTTILPPNLPADVRVLKFANYDCVTVGQIITYRIQIQNLGPGIARNIILTDNLPVELIDAEYSIDGGNLWYAWSGGYTVGDLSVSSYVEVLIRGRVARTCKKHLTNTATVSSNTPDPDLSNNSSSVTITVDRPCHCCHKCPPKDDCWYRDTCCDNTHYCYDDYYQDNNFYSPDCHYTDDYDFDC